MASGGHNAKTTANHERDGTLHSTRHRDRIDYPKLKDIPKAPAYFTKEQVAKWNLICTMLKRDGMLSDTYLELVERYCNAWLTWDKARREVDATGLTFTTDSGQIRQNPAVNIERESMVVMLRILVEFGYTPRSSMVIKAPKDVKADDDPLAEIFGTN